LGRQAPRFGGVRGEKAVLGDRREAARDERVRSTGAGAQEGGVFRQLDGELGQEVVADDPELSLSRLQQR